MSGSRTPLVRLGYLASIQSGITVDGNRSDGPHDVTLPYLRVANVQDGHLDLGTITEIRVPKSLARSATLRSGDVLMTEGGDLDKLGRGTVWDGEIKNCLHQNHVFAVRPDSSKLLPEYLALVTQSSYARAYFESTGTKTTNLASTSSSKIRDFRIPLVDLDEQRRITNFLDVETARIDTIAMTRQQQMLLQARRFTQIIDGVVVGDPDALATIGYVGNASDWNTGKVARLFSIIPGFAFASDNFVPAYSGTRLLRGINVSSGHIDWTAETVAWDVESAPINQRYHLRLDDLVVGMDRPWISSGTRVALIRENDLPSLLLQRVACIRPRSTSTTRYLRWVLTSSHFQSALESETTGVSVPHISGEQIGAFIYRLPPPREQRILARLLEAQHQVHVSQRELVDRQLTALAERRQALITAAVTGGITV